MRPRNVARNILKHINITDKSVLLVKPGSAMSSPRNLRALATQLHHNGKSGVIIIVAEHDDIHTASEQEMNDSGWYRKESDGD